MDLVAVKRAPEATRKAVEDLLHMLDPLSIKPDQSVVVKPNICYHRNTDNMITTDLHLIHATLEILKEQTNNIVVVESDNRTGTAGYRAEKSGLLDVLSTLGVPFRNLSEEKDVTKFDYGGGHFSIPRIATEANHLVNICKLKTCIGMTVSLSLKNLFGLIAERAKPRMHRHLDEVLVAVNRAIRRQVVIVDGIVGMEGNGPLVGNPVPLGILAAGTRPGAVDHVCSRLIGFDPAQISHIRLACENGLGPTRVEDIEVVGMRLETIREFRPPSYLPSALLRTLKSAAKIYSPV